MGAEEVFPKSSPGAGTKTPKSRVQPVDNVASAFTFLCGEIPLELGVDECTFPS